ncbi:MAG: hypothetical protein M1818_007184 [Claussenomyces sp. TS43310]|nr:MAG: hypothetical protein M1818_007184 [Claussenomyces sp. TS43310]
MAEPAEEQNTGLAAESDDHVDDNDSAFGDGSGSSTTSISSSILHYREENGRTYHAYNSGSKAAGRLDRNSAVYDIDMAQNIHFRMMRHLTPGGWIEVTDISFPIRCDDGSLPLDSALYRWSEQMLEASYSLGRPLNSAESYKEQLENVGFVEAAERQLMWPQNRWPKDRRFKEIGMWTVENLTTGLSGLSLALFTRGLGMPAEEVEIFLIDVRKDMKSMKMHAYWPMLVPHTFANCDSWILTCGKAM